MVVNNSFFNNSENNEGLMLIVLVVDDSLNIHRKIKEALSDPRIVVESAYYHEMAMEIVNRGDCDIIFMDACLDGDRPDTLELTEEIRKITDIPIVAMSSVKEYRDEQLKHGCNHQIDKDVISTLVNKSLLRNLIKPHEKIFKN